MRMLLGISPVTSGEYRIYGKVVGKPETRERIGVVPQTDNLDPDFTVMENLLVYASYFSIKKEVALARARNLLEFCRLQGREESAVSQLSGGMRRRLMIARALINDPDLLVLDEPTTGLDPQARHLIWQRLNALIREGKTLILTTHYMEEAMQLCHEILILDRGNIVDQGTPKDLIRRHVEPEVVELRGIRQASLVYSLFQGVNARIESVGDGWFCYLEDARLAIDRLKHRQDLFFLHRPTNLEDVFLKLTGRDLRD